MGENSIADLTNVHLENRGQLPSNSLSRVRKAKVNFLSETRLQKASRWPLQNLKTHLWEHQGTQKTRGARCYERMKAEIIESMKV